MEILRQLLSELIAIALMLVPIGLYALYRARKSRQSSENLYQEYDKNLQNFAAYFGCEYQDKVSKFSELLDDLASKGSGKIFKFSKSVSQNEFIQTLNLQNFASNFREQKFTSESISQEFISLAASNLNEPLALGLYLLDDHFYAILCAQDELYALIDTAANLGENIIIGD